MTKDENIPQVIVITWDKQDLRSKQSISFASAKGLPKSICFGTFFGSCTWGNGQKVATVATEYGLWNIEHCGAIH